MSEIKTHRHAMVPDLLIGLAEERKDYSNHVQLGYNTKLERLGFLDSCFDLRASITSAVEVDASIWVFIARGTIWCSVSDRLIETGTSPGRNKLFQSSAVLRNG